MPALAALGGVPVRSTYLSYGKQCIDDNDIETVVKVLKSPYLTCGPMVSAFEKQICQTTGAQYALTVSNGTAALHVACLAAGIGPGDEVITTPITFAASANAILYCGGVPVFADIDLETYCIDPDSIETKISKRTKAVIAVDFTGQACQLDKIRAICDRYRLVLIEDAAHSLGTVYQERPVGSIADFTTFSFHPVKTVTSGEGGAITTSDHDNYDKILHYARHGITRDPRRLTDHTNSNWYYEQQYLGYNYRLTDFQCALGMSQMKKLPLFARRRKELTALYDEYLTWIPEVLLQKEMPGSNTVRHLYVVRLDFGRLKVGRKEVYDALQAENIGVNVHYIPVYYFPYYKGLGYSQGACPNAEAYYESCITLPLHCAMTNEDLCDVATAVEKVISYYRK